MLIAQKIVAGRLNVDISALYELEMQEAAQIAVNRFLFNTRLSHCASISQHYGVNITMVVDENSTTISELDDKIENNEVQCKNQAHLILE